MFETTYTINWVTPYSAMLSWDGGLVDVMWSIYVDGIAQGSFEDSGTIEKIVNLSSDDNHSIAIIKHDSALDNIVSPESIRLLRPVIRWLAVNNAIEYEIRQIDDTYDEEYLLHVEKSNDIGYHSWQVPINLPVEGLGNLRIKIYARGSWGFSETPYIVLGFVAGHPPKVTDINVNVSSGGDLELILSQG